MRRVIISAMPDKPEKGKRRRHAIRFSAISLAIEAVTLWMRSGRLAGSVVVRCHSGHLYTTIWIPGASVKAVRLGPWRLQRCPVGKHWSMVTPVKESELGRRERRAARGARDLRVP
jgi:hypothetical protein